MQLERNIGSNLKYSSSMLGLSSIHFELVNSSSNVILNTYIKGTNSRIFVINKAYQIICNGISKNKFSQTGAGAVHAKSEKKKTNIGFEETLNQVQESLGIVPVNAVSVSPSNVEY
jgi:hypothetical protein